MPQLPSRPPLLSGLAVALAAAALAARIADARSSTLDYPACPETHAPEMFCCEYSPTVKHVYTKFNLPTGGPFEDEFREGWNKVRQVNFPYRKYTPDTPTFYYDKPETICRTQTIVVDKTNGAVDETLQCADQNASLVDESKDATVFWTFAKNIRNNNVSFPIGAACTSLMDKTTGAVDEARRALCVSTAATVTPQFTTYTEGALVAIYVIYAVFFALLCAWYLFKKAHKAKLESATDNAEKRLLADRGGPATPQSMEVDEKHLQIRVSDARLQLDSDSVLQTGYSQSIFGTLVFVYYALATIGMSVLLLFIIMDYYTVFSPPLFSSSGPNVVAFFITWLCTAIWYVITVSLVKHVANFFRVESGLSVCDYVHIVKRDDTEVLLHDKSGVSDFVARLEKFFMPDDYIKGFRQTLPVQTIDGTRVIVFQHVQYLYEPLVDRFVPGAIPLGRTYADLLDEAGGLTETEARERFQIVGSNDVNVEMPSMLKSLVQEFFTLFYVYQIMCYFVWYYFDYYTLAIVMTSVILISAAINIYTKRRMQASVVQMTSYTTDVTVCRDKTWRTVKSPELVPGDLVRVSENWELPCDMVIVRGSTVCDESMLTGESMPVQKFPIPDNSKAEYDPEGASKKHTLFAGTRVLSSGRNEEILAIVQTTGAHTSKGQLVQSILFPLPMRFKYDEHLKVLIGGLLMYGVIAASLAVHFLTSNGNLSNKMTAFCYCVFMISGIVSPLLPVVITVGQVNASQRLEKRGVFSLNTQRITLCGKVRVFCFDKTGTLTKQGLDFLGVQLVNSDGTFGALVKDVQNTNALAAVAQYAIATCHSVGSHDGRYVGNEVEVKMLTASGWTLVEREGEKPFVTSPTDPNVALEFVKRYDFDHHRMSMSVVVRDRASGKHYVFCKGSYERMQELSLDATVPADYKTVADHLAKDGCYVLGVSYRELPSDWSPEDIDRFVSDREAVDTELSLLGLVLFRNEIKDDTPSAIAALKAGDTRVVMITGDNAMCGCYIARESGMIDAQSRVILGDMVENALEWRDVDHGTTYSLTDIQSMITNNEDIELAVTGTAFDTLVATGDIETLLLHIRIFSRMTPSGKVECVKLHMETGAVTGMCGDGGNDCGALRIAHVGVALSDADASVVSPFTSRSKTVTSVVDLCREGRCSVATSFASVKMLVMYGVIASTLRLFQYYNGVIMSEWCYILADGFTMVGLSYVITLSRPLPTLGPQRPTSSLIGPTTLVSLIGQELINVIFLFTGIHLLTSQDWYCPFTPDNVDLAKWWLLSDNAMATCLFYSVITQQQVAAWVFSFGTHYRLPIYRNYALVIAIVVLIALDLYLILGEPSVVTDLFRIASGTNVIGLPYIPLPHSFRVKYLLVIIGDVVAVNLFEYIVVLGPVRDYFRRKHHVDTLPMRK